MDFPGVNDNFYCLSGRYAFCGVPIIPEGSMSYWVASGNRLHLFSSYNICSEVTSLQYGVGGGLVSY